MTTPNVPVPGQLYCLACITQQRQSAGNGDKAIQPVLPAITLAPMAMPNGQFVAVPACPNHLQTSRISPLIIGKG